MQKKSYLQIFLISFFSMLLILLPNIISNHGLFLYAGDYYFQQIPFYTHAVNVLRKYGIGWDWYTDLGSDFFTSYSYYLTGSIFFWMISWISSEIIMYVMPLMLAFKTAVGAVGAYAYIVRYVKKNEAAFVGAYMYAFSGFQMVSMIYNTFHEITALFPFLLLAFDLLVKEKKKIFFAFMVGLVALTNYYFFVGIVIFVILYYIVKCIRKEFNFSAGSFVSITLESLIGVGTASVILVPTFMLLSSADRIGDTLYGVDLVSYSDNTIIPKIIQSIFLIPDPPSHGMLFQSQENPNNWASISLYLPLFTITGVYSYIKSKKNDWISTILIICFVIMLIPGFNSAFSLFNSAYYARWYYMPVLLMCLATAKTLEEGLDLNPGLKLETSGIALLSVISCLPNKVIADDAGKLALALDPESNPEEEIKWFSMSPLPTIFWQCMTFSIVSLLIIYIYNREKNKENIKNISKKITYFLVAFVIVINVIFINNTVQELGFDRADNMPYRLLTDDTPQLNDEDSFRMAYTYGEGYNNHSMIWERMNISCFNSIEANEIDDFFFNVQGDERRMQGEYKDTDYPAYGLLSVKYIFNASTGDDLNVELKPVDLKGCSLYDKQGMYYIYKNDHFVPFGVSYEYCIDDETLENYLEENIGSEAKYQYKKMIMMRALVLEKEDCEQYKDYISPLPSSMIESLDDETYFSDCDEKSEKSCSSFEYDSKGYKAEITVDKPSLVYFSVPCSAGWKARVNGKEVEVIKAHYGLTAVAVEKGKNNIEFSYETSGFKVGKNMTFISLAVLAVYAFIIITIKNRKRSGT